MQLYLLSVLPLLLVAAWLAYQNVQSVYREQDRQATQIAHNLASAVDQRLRISIQALNAIAQSAHLDTESQWPLLYQEAKNLKPTQDMDVVIVDAEPPYRMRMSTLVPLGSPLPPTPNTEGYQAMPAAIVTRAPAVGDQLVSVFTKRSVVAVAVPAVRQGRVIYAVVSPIDVAQFQHFLDDFSLPDGWAIALRDGTGQALATRTPAKFVPADDMGTAGQVEVTSSLARWQVVLQIPAQARQAALWNTGSALVLLVLAATLAGALAGWMGSRRVGQAMAALTGSGNEVTDLGITEIHNAKRSLDESAERERLSDARFRHLFHDAPIGMRLTDESGKVVAQNSAFDNLFGYTLADAPTLDRWRELAYPDPHLRAQVKQAWREVATGQKKGADNVAFDEFQITARNGQRRAVQIRGNLLTEGLLTSFIDVTEQRDAQAGLKLWADAFENAELNLSISDARTNTFRVVNPAFARLHGYKREEMAGMSIGCIIPEGASDAVKERFDDMNAGTHAVIESENLRKDGSRFPVQLDVTVLKDAQGLAVSRLAYAVDLTERNRIAAEIKSLHETLERRVIERTAQLSQANQELDSFAYTVSHDLRAPLRSMDGFLHLLREEHGNLLPQDAQEYLDKINGAIQRMKNLIEGILTLTHSARHDMQITPVNLSDLVSKHLNELTSAEPDHLVHINVQSGIVAMGDVRMLEVVVSNLVGNAWKYTAKTAAPSIRFFARRKDGKTWFCLADNGAGFDDSLAERLFQPFQRMHRHEEFPGIGIGLATVQRIVLRHGGHIHAHASPGQGATFCFNLNPSTSENASEV